MATNHLNSCQNADEDYIDMDVSSSSSSTFFFSNITSNSSPQNSREFEFQMSSASDEKDSTTSPADELFYKGKLLPLHLPPRLQMVQKLLLQTSTTTTSFHQNPKETFLEDAFFRTSSSSSTAPSTNTSTPSESWNISPSESCRVSCELNPAEYFFEWSTELRSFINNHPKKSWSKNLRLIRQYSITQKLKASRVYLKSLFSKSACSDESCAKAACNLESPGGFGKARESSNKFIKVAKKTPFGYIGRGTLPTPASVAKSIEKETIEECITQHRRSFSRTIKRHSPTKCLSSSSSSSSPSSGASSLSSSFSINSNVLYDLQSLRRSSSATSEIDGSIEAAIAHCKSSQRSFNSRNTLTDAGFCSLSSAKIAPSENQDKKRFL
ncbi:hypothetical protein M9H77_03452 [Catharanthus roseus]|uniref:Uncharacterized protein n=1 Tax=Catharanthus roseus TaxID=4058 RepID=A0ACC0CBG6_CATRO|nr:hypothetical protein M9H77_03452 [Catharanthus roseus]